MKRLTLKFIDNINKTEGKLHYQEEYFDLMNIIDLERLNQMGSRAEKGESKGEAKKEGRKWKSLSTRIKNLKHY